MSSRATQVSRSGPRACWMIVLATLLSWGSSAALAGVDNERATQALDEARHMRAHVLPAKARPHGYSLQDMARATAAFNVTDHSGPVPNTPFQILFTSAANPDNTFNVMQGKTLYVPVLFNDNSAPVIGDFPTNAENHRQLLKYWFSQQQFGVVASDVTIDGKKKELSGAYVSGVSFDLPLPDTATQYATTAVFIAPLPPGDRKSVV